MCGCKCTRLHHFQLQLLHNFLMKFFKSLVWPEGSPDLCPNDLFLWGYYKPKICNNVQIQNIQELRYRIFTTCNELNSKFLSNSVQAFYNHLPYYLERELISNKCFKMFLFYFLVLYLL